MKKKIVKKTFFQCSDEDERDKWLKQAMKDFSLPKPFLLTKEDLKRKIK